MYGKKKSQGGCKGSDCADCIEGTIEIQTCNDINWKNPHKEDQATDSIYNEIFDFRNRKSANRDYR